MFGSTPPIGGVDPNMVRLRYGAGISEYPFYEQKVYLLFAVYLI